MSLSWSWILVGSCLLLSPIKLILILPFLTIGIRYLCEVGYLSLPRSRIALAYVLLMMPSLALSTFRTLLDTTEDDTDGGHGGCIVVDISGPTIRRSVSATDVYCDIRRSDRLSCQVIVGRPKKVFWWNASLAA